MLDRLSDAHHSRENESVQSQTFLGRVVKAPRLIQIYKNNPLATFKLEIVENGEVHKREVRVHGTELVQIVSGITVGREVTVIGKFFIDITRKANGQPRTRKVINAEDIKVAG